MDISRFAALATSYAFLLLIGLLAPTAAAGAVLTAAWLAATVGISAFLGLAMAVATYGLGRNRRRS